MYSLDKLNGTIHYTLCMQYEEGKVMNYDGFLRPTNHYDAQVQDIDEEICKLIAKRKELSEFPGFPTDDLIVQWAKKYGFYEDFLNGVFGQLHAEHHFQPQIEPQGFVGNIPVLKSFTKDRLFYAVTSIRQYDNASIVNLTVDHETLTEDEVPMAHTIIGGDLELRVTDPSGITYVTQNRGGGGFDGHTAFQFLVSPPLPSDLAGVKLLFSDLQKEGVSFEFELNEA